MCRFFCRHKFSTPLGKYKGTQLLDLIRVFQFRKKMPNCLPKWLYYFVFPLAMNKSYCCPKSSSTLGVVSVWIFAIQIGMQWYFVVLICNYLMTCHVEHLLTCLFANYVFSLVRCLFRSFAHFSIRLFIFLLLDFRSSLYILYNSTFVRGVLCKYFLPVSGLPYSLDNVFCRAKVYNFNSVQLINCFFNELCLWYCI